MIASLKSEPTRNIVEKADEMLVGIAHRGGCGCDPASGDGSGTLFGMPDAFMRSEAEKLFGATLPTTGEYAVRNTFFPPVSNESG